MANPVQYAKLAAQVMDQSKPGWADMIDMSTFDMRDFKLCIIGQCFPEFEYNKALKKLKPLIEYNMGDVERVNKIFDPNEWESEDSVVYVNTIDAEIAQRRSKA